LDNETNFGEQIVLFFC